MISTDNANAHIIDIQVDPSTGGDAVIACDCAGNPLNITAAIYNYKVRETWPGKLRVANGNEAHTYISEVGHQDAMREANELRQRLQMRDTAFNNLLDIPLVAFALSVHNWFKFVTTYFFDAYKEFRK